MGWRRSTASRAATKLQELERELTLDQKMTILSNLDMDGVRLDISGGDPLVLSDNVAMLRAASAKLGRHNVTLTATGSGLAGIDLPELVSLVGEFNFTYDSASMEDVAHRPDAYAAANLIEGRKLAALGAATRAEFPITRSTSSPEHIRSLYLNLHEAGIGKLLLMRLFPSGRGVTVQDEVLSPAEYRIAIAQLRALEHEFGTPKVKLQCALRYLDIQMEGIPAAANPCDMVRESFGLTSLGVLLASPWALNASGHPSKPEFVLGSLLEQPLSQILAGPKVAEFRERTDENFGHCKIFAERFSPYSATLDRVHDSADPLYKTGLAGPDTWRDCRETARTPAK